MGVGMRELIIILLIVAFIWPYGRILSRAGYSPWLCIIAAVPLVNVVALWIFAYAKWPAIDRPPAA
jgi:hypothetical protein